MNLTIENLKSLVAEIRKVLPDAIIAGGAPRDVYHHRPVKDIDVMTGYGLTKSVLERLATAVGGTFQVAETASGDEDFEYEIHFDSQFPRLNVIDIQSFGDTDPVDNIHDFDFGLSQIAVTPRGVIYTDAFLADTALQRLTYMHHKTDGTAQREQWRTVSSANRLVRLLDKYPTFTPVNDTYLKSLIVTDIM